MKVIEKLSDKISDEIQDAKCYAKMALEEREPHRSLADTLYTISNEEMRHMQMLHGEVARLIAEYRQAKGDPPADMLAVYEYLHRQHIDAAAEVRTLQAMYKEG